MDILQFIKEKLGEVKSDYNYKINPELNFNFQADKDNVVLRLQQGNRYLRGVVIPLSILITTKNPLQCVEVWSDFVGSVSDRTVVEGVDSYYFMLMTPAISQVFDEISNNYYSVVQVIGTIVETNAIDDIIKFEIGDEELEIIEMTYMLQNTVEPSPRGSLVHADAVSGVLSGSITTYIGDNDFFLELMTMRRNGSNINMPFVVKITWQSGEIETFNAKITLQSFIKRRGELSRVNINFTHST